jgi:hypothetical protein
MSWDLSGKNTVCDHLQILERYAISPLDFRTLQYAANTTLNMRAPINGVSLVRLYYKGSLVYPTDPIYGYSVVLDPNRIQTGYAFQKIVFNTPVRATTPLVEVSYVTRQGFCAKCGGTGVVPDWTVSPSGKLNRVRGVVKLSQQVFKYTLSSKVPFNPNLACPVRTYIGKKFGVGITDQDVSTAITQILDRYQSIQRAQSTVQTMDANEMLQNVNSVLAQQDANDPTVINIQIEITAYGTTQTIPLNLALQTTGEG